MSFIFFLYHYLNSKLCTYSYFPISVFYVYGLSKFIRDANFMLNRNLGRYWKVCWGFIVPGTLSFLFLYLISTFSVPKYGDKVFPDSAIICGILLVVISLIQVPMGGIYSYFKSENSSFVSKFWGLTKPTKNWGPQDDKVRNEWLGHCQMTTSSSEEALSLINNATTDQTSN